MQRCEYLGYYKNEVTKAMDHRWLPGVFIGLGQGIWSNSGGPSGAGGIVDQPAAIVQPVNGALITLDPESVRMLDPYLRECWVSNDTSPMLTHCYFHSADVDRKEAVVEDVSFGKLRCVKIKHVCFKQPKA